MRVGRWIRSLSTCLLMLAACSARRGDSPRDGGPKDAEAGDAEAKDAEAMDLIAELAAEVGGDAVIDAGCASYCTLCADGRCAIEIDQGEEHPYNVVLDGTRVYWSRTFTADPRSASIRMAPIGGGPASDLYAALDTPHTLIRNQTHLYWTQITDDGGIWRAPLDGSAAPTQIVFGQAQPHGLTIDRNNIYWSNLAGSAPDGGIPAGAIVKMSLSGGPPQVLASDQPSPANLAVDEHFLYWTTWRDFGSVMRVPIAGGDPEVVASLQAAPYGLAVDGRNVYWTNTGGSTAGGSVMKQALAGGAPVVLAQNQIAAPYGIAVDDSWVYWSNYDVTGKGALMKVRIDGGEPIRLIEAASYGFAVDATSIYWTNYERGTVWKLTPK